MGKIVNLTDDGIIYAKYLPVMDRDACDLYIKEFKQEISNASGKVLVLTDVTGESGIPNNESKQIIIDGIKGHRDRILKSALVIDSTVKRLAARVILFASKRDDVTIFGKVDDALAWLRKEE